MVAGLSAKFGGLVFFIQNARRLRRVPVFKSQQMMAITYRGYVKTDAFAVEEMYAGLNNGAHFRSLRKYLYDPFGRRCLLVATQNNETGGEIVVGINMYYLNARDIKEQTIHEAFIGVAPEMTGRGIATSMRKIAITHFKFAGFLGISTRISVEYKPSLQSAIKIGFERVEQYIDNASGAQRYYMLYKLQG